ncbi:MAG: hypothetical protein ACFFBD_18395 [Candidatus Hodarchaeota archaeon]
MTAPAEVASFSCGHYYAKIPSKFLDAGKKWIKDVNDFGYPKMVDVLGFPPQIDKYILEIIPTSKLYGAYYGKRTIDNFEGGYIVFQTLPPEAAKPFPRNLEGGLVFETIHGFLQPLKFRDQWGTQKTVLDLDESFDILFEAEVDKRLGLKEFEKSLKHTYSTQPKRYRYFGVLWDIRDEFGWTPFQEFFKMLRDSSTPLAVDDSTLYNYLSKCVGVDVRTYFIKHGFEIEELLRNKEHPGFGVLPG